MTLVLNGTTGVSSVDGSASTPAIQGTDSNTGVFFPAADTIAWTTGGTERMRVDSSGNVGIGTTSPGTFSKLALQVDGTTTPTNATNVGPSSISLYAATNGGSTNSTVGIFGWQASQPGIGSGIGFSRENSSDWGSQIRFYTHPTTTSNISDLTERARIDSSGRWMVGTTNTDPTFNRTNGTVVQSAGQILCRANGSWDVGRDVTSGTHITFYTDNGSARVTAGNIASNGNVTSYNTGSDYRLKEDVRPLSDALARVSQLRPVQWAWKQGLGGTFARGEGFIAHELAEVVPQCVTGEKDAVDAEGNPVYQGIDTSFLVATLTAAIQELKAELDTAKARIAALEAA